MREDGGVVRDDAIGEQPTALAPQGGRPTVVSDEPPLGGRASHSLHFAGRLSRQSLSKPRKRPRLATRLFTENAFCSKSHLREAGQNSGDFREFGQTAADDKTVGPTPRCGHHLPGLPGVGLPVATRKRTFSVAKGGDQPEPQGKRPVPPGEASRPGISNDSVRPLAKKAQTQHPCHRGQSSEPEAVKMGHRGGMRLPVSPLGISLSELAIRNLPRFEGVTHSGPLDSASFSSPFAQNAKCQRLSLPLVTRVLGLGPVAGPTRRSGRTSGGFTGR